MANDIKTSQPVSGDQMGITFNEIHSDEPHEAVNASKTEVEQKHTSAPPSHLSSKEDVFNVSKGLESGHIEAGTIVSDKKGSRPSFGENILSAFGEWWGKTKGTIDDSAVAMQAPITITKPQPLVSKVETRVDVVKTAATHATLAPKDDHKMVVQKIRTFKQDVARVQNAGVVVKEESAKKSGWTHTEEKPVTPVKKIEPDTFTASVAVEQKMIPVPLPPNSQRPPVPVPQTPRVPVPQPVLPKVVLRTTVETKTAVVPPRPIEQSAPSTPRITVPDTVVKKDTSVPKKNIWVAPRVQPESSVLMPHSTPTPVSQSYIPNQTPVPPQTSPTQSTPTQVPKSIPAPLPTQGAVNTLHASEVSSPASVSPSAPFVTKTFHTTNTEESLDARTVPEALPQPKESTNSSFNTMTTPLVSKLIEKPVTPQKEEPAVLKEVSRVQPLTPPIPKAPAPLPNTPQNEIAGTKSLIPMERVPQSHTPPRIVRPALYTKPHTTAPHAKTSGWSSAEGPTRTPVLVPQVSSVPRRQESSPEIKEHVPPLPVANVPMPRVTPPVPRQLPETPRVVSVPLPRPTPQENPEPIFEPPLLSKEVPEENSAREIPEPEVDRFVPRTSPPPSPSRPIAVPPLSRVVSTPIPTAQPVSPNKAFRTFVKWAILTCIILFGIALALFASFYFNVFEKETPPEQPTIAVPTFLATNMQTPLMIEGTKEIFLTTLKENVKNAGVGLTQFYPTIQEGEAKRLGTSDEILSFLNTHLDQRTRRSLNKTLMIGSITTTKNEPFIVLQSSNFDVLFTGLIAWEPHIYSDFAPLFGETLPSQIKFKDAVRDNTSTRILYDESGKEILLYSFINQNTVVITTSGEALSELIKKF